ncbi:MAG: hypothetical protein GY849_01995, partial [Deltaproteobacteria bacterium]|nr:hypothetical protein [Deltaproteobacteria bacterium]
ESAVVRARAVSGLSIAADVRVEATLLADRQAYAPHETAHLSGAVTNAGANHVMHDLTARVAVTDAQYLELFSTSTAIATFEPGTVVPITASWDVETAAPGSYTASLSVRDDQGRLVAYASTELEVESSAETGAGLVGELAVSPTEVGAGAPLVATWTVTNTGNADLENFTLRTDLVVVATEEVVDFEDAYLDLAQQQTRLGGAAFPTLTLASGNYLATLTALVPYGERRLDSAAFTVGRGVSVNDVAILEGDSGSRIAQFAITLSPASASTEAITVDYATADAGATAGDDYQAATGTVSFAPGETAATVDV